MSTDRGEYLPDDPVVGVVERQAVREYGFFRMIEKTGLWTVNLSMAPAPIFRIIANIPGTTVDKYGRRSHRDNFFFCVRYGRVIGSRKPGIVWPGDADIPDNPNFRSPPIFYSSLTIEKHLSFLFKPTFQEKREMRVRSDQEAEGCPSVVLAIKACSALNAAYTQEKLSEVGLGRWLENVFLPPEEVPEEVDKDLAEAALVGLTETVPVSRKKFAIKNEIETNIQRDYASKSATAAAERIKRISELAILGSRIDTLRSNPLEVPLYIDRQALDAIRGHIHWARNSYENRVEQGGVIIGEEVQSDEMKRTAIVTLALPARGTQGSSAYVKFDHAVWKQIYDEFDSRVRIGVIRPKQTIIGWYHTHPRMDVFMSGTDMGTQRSLFHKDGNFALVLNPQDKLCGCFRGSNAKPTPLIEVDIMSFSLSSQKSYD